MASPDARPAVLWLPGWSMDDRAWARVQAGLPQCRHINVDLAAGSSPHRYVGAMVRAMRAHPNAVVVGWSLGGMLALRYLSPDTRVRALVLVAATTRFASDNPRLGWSPRVLARMQRNLTTAPLATRQAFLSAMFTEEERTAGHEASFRAANEPCTWEADSLKLGLDFLARMDLQAAPEQLTLPVVWLHGTRDTICPFGGFVALRERLALYHGHHFSAVDGAGHALPWVAPEAICAAVREVLP